MRCGRALIAWAILSAVVLGAAAPPRPAPASAAIPRQVPSAIVTLTKAVRGGVQSVAPGEPFTYTLNYGCSASLEVGCEAVEITDVVPVELSRGLNDVTFAGANLPPAMTYDPSTGRATFPLGSLPDGSSGQITMTVRFPTSAEPGREAVNTGTISAANAPTVTSTAAPVTVHGASTVQVNKRRTTGPAQLDTPVTYELTATLGAGGTQTVADARIVDRLPSGAVFQSATGGGTHDASTQQVTWSLGDLTPDPSQPASTRREVTVLFPSSVFASGTRVVNTFDLFGAPGGGNQELLGSASDEATLRPEGAFVTARKVATKSQLGPGQTDVYTVTATAPDASDLTAMTVVDQLPSGLVADRAGGPNLSGAGPAPAVTVSIGGTTQPLAVASAGAGWSATVPAAADSIIVDLGPAAAGTSATFQLRAGIPADGVGRDGLPVAAGTALRNCAAVSGEAPGTTVVSRTSCVEQAVVPLVVEFAKRLTSTVAAVEPGGSATWAIDVAIPQTSASALIQPVIVDCLPLGFDLMDPAVPSTGTSTTGFDPPPMVQRSTGACAPDRVQVTWSWPAPFTLEPGQSGSIALQARADPGAAPGTFVNEATLTADNMAQAERREAPIAITSTTLVVGRLTVQGESGLGSPGTVGHTRAGGSVTYAAEVENVSAVPLSHLVIVDVLPTPGDTGVRSSTPRLSEWQPLFAGGVSSTPAAPELVVWYSSSHNPCRPEVAFTGPCEPANWSLAPSGAAAQQDSSVGALRADFGDFVLQPGGRVTFRWTMTTPNDVPPGKVAWNSFAFTAQRADNAEQLEATEPAKVGLLVVGQDQLALRVVKRVNGLVGAQPPGPFFTAGDELTFTYEVTNVGTVSAFNVTVVDDVIGPIPCPQATLQPGESMICTAPPQIAVAGQQTNVGTVLAGQSLDAPVAALDSDRVWNFNGVRNRPLIDVTKMINGQQARRPPGLNVPAGDPVEFTYRVRNGGALTLAGITLTDDRLTGVSCPFTSLRPGEDMLCTAPVQVAVEGAYVNIATVTGQPRNPGGSGVGDPVSDRDRAFYTNTIVVTGSTAVPLAALAGVLVITGLILMVITRPPAGPRAAAGRG